MKPRTRFDNMLIKGGWNKRPAKSSKEVTEKITRSLISVSSPKKKRQAEEETYPGLQTQRDLESNQENTPSHFATAFRPHPGHVAFLGH